MAIALKRLEKDLLKLPAESRARLASRLIESLDQPFDPEIERLWIEEAKTRSAELHAGKVKTVPLSKALKKARSLLR